MTLGKRRVQAHIIGALGVNHVERQVLLAGQTLNRIIDDYGLDGIIQTYDKNGVIQPTIFGVQVKATKQIKLSSDNSALKFSLSKRDIEYWIRHVIPIVLVVYELKRDKAYYLDIQEYFRTHREKLRKVNKFIQILIPLSNVFDAKAVKAIKKKCDEAF